jgi:hypothetical protein
MRFRSVLVSLLALGLAACGGDSLSASQLRDTTVKICAAADRITDQIATPTTPKEGVEYLRRGVAALTPELNQLRTLHPPSDLADQYRTALDATASEIRALQNGMKGLRAGGDPVVEIKTLQHHLAPLEAKADRAWASADIRGCMSR